MALFQYLPIWTLFTMIGIRVFVCTWRFEVVQNADIPQISVILWYKALSEYVQQISTKTHLQRTVGYWRAGRSEENTTEAKTSSRPPTEELANTQIPTHAESIHLPLHKWVMLFSALIKK